MPPPPDRLHRLAAGSLLLAKRRAAKLIETAAQQHIAETAVEAQRRDRERKTSLLVLLLLASRRMVPTLVAAIVAARHGARVASQRRLLAELKASGLDLAASSRPLMILAASERHQDDILRATMAAESLAAQWRGIALQAASSADRDGKDAARAIARSGQALKPRSERTAATESAHAYNDEHRELVRGFAKYDDELDEMLMREWSAMIDACERCWPHDGERVGIDEAFSGGDEPGSMHPRCLCVEVIVSATETMRKAG